MAIFGIDISAHQAGIDLGRAKNEGVKFAILRAGYTGYGNGVSKAKDTSFETFYSQCKALGIGVGAYWFSCANTYEKGVAEAEWMYENCLKGKQFEYPIYTDVEEDGGGRHYLSGSGKAGVTAGIRGFCETLEKKGYYAGVYANSDWFNRLIDASIPGRFDCWLANWGTSNPSTPAHGMWQFGGETNRIRSNKIAGRTVDQDYAYKDYPAIMKKLGKNGFGKGTPVKPTPDKPNTGSSVYRVRTMNGSYLEWVRGYGNGTDGYAGVYGRSIDGLQIQDKTYQVHIKGMLRGKWLNWVTGYGKGIDGYAGIYGRAIDGIRVKGTAYRVHLKGGSWLPWVNKCDNTNNGYAGIYGKEIDAIQIK